MFFIAVMIAIVAFLVLLSLVISIVDILEPSQQLLESKARHFRRIFAVRLGYLQPTTKFDFGLKYARTTL